MLTPQLSARGNKHMENVHRPLGTNLLATLSGAANGVGNLAAVLNPANQQLTLSQFLTLNHNNGNVPLLWVYTNNGGMIDVRFGYDTLVNNANGIGQSKIGHVALMDRAIISGEIHPVAGGWELDNNSGAWGAMSNEDGKSTMMAAIAQFMSREPSMVVTARKAYSRKGWKRAIQQVFR